MPQLVGAIACRVNPSGTLKLEMEFWELIETAASSSSSRNVECRKCGQSYTLLEEEDVQDDLLQEDLEFLAKALSSGHPQHPERLVVRDPVGAISKAFSLGNAAQPSSVMRTVPPERANAEQHSHEAVLIASSEPGELTTKWCSIAFGVPS